MFGLKRNLRMIVIAVTAAASVGISPLMAREPNQSAGLKVELPSPPQIGFAMVPASRLHLGMTATELTSIMGEASKATVWIDGGIEFRRLDFRAGPIPSKVTLKAGKVSSVVLDVFKVDKDDLPVFSRQAWPGMISAAVQRALGAPIDVSHHTFYAIKLDQLVFQQSGEPEVSVFFVANRVVAKSVGRSIPPEIFQVDLPSPPDLARREAIKFAQVGMTAHDVKALNGPEKFHVDYTFNGRSVWRAIYETRARNYFTSATFVDGVLTEIEDLGRLPDEVFQAG